MTSESTEPAGKSILVIAGEVSGDMHAAKVVRRMQEADASLSFWGVGGDELRSFGVEIIHDVREMAVMGLSEVLQKYAFFKKVMGQMVALAEERRPDAVLLIDYPGFNLRFAARMHELGIKVLYYICPQVWAWHRSRIGEMARIVDHLYVIFPFEVDVFAETSLKVDFVGHPLVDEAQKALDAPLVDLPWKGSKHVALLPGSRRQEVKRILPPMWKAARLLEKEDDAVGFLLAAPGEEIAEYIRSVTAEAGQGPERCEIVVGQTRQVLRQASAAMVASGTATIEAALMNCPMLVVYKAAWLTYMLGRMLVQVPNIGMVNIVAGREICPEFIQGRANAGALKRALRKLLGDSQERERVLRDLESVRSRLGSGGAAETAALAILEELS